MHTKAVNESADRPVHASDVHLGTFAAELNHDAVQHADRRDVPEMGERHVDDHAIQRLVEIEVMDKPVSRGKEDLPGYGIGACLALQHRGDRHKAGHFGGKVQRRNQHAGQYPNARLWVATTTATVATLRWMTFFGNSAIWLIVQQGATDLPQTIVSDQTLALFNFPEHLPFSSLLSFIAMAMVAVLFVTSADSGARVVDTLASGGTDKPPCRYGLFKALRVDACLQQ